jgi:hypothetical protein
MTVIVLGDTADTFANDFGVTTYPEAFRYVAPANATISSLQAKIHCNTNPFTLTLGVYDEVDGEPGALLESQSVSRASIPSGFDWAEVTGFSVPIVEGTAYYLAIWLSDAGAITYTGGTGVTEWDADTDSPTGLLDPFSSPRSTYENAAVGIRAYGTLTGGGGGGGSGPLSHDPQELTFTLCNLDGEPLDDLQSVGDGDGFTITINDATVGTCTISVDDEIAVPPREARHVVRIVYGDAIGINGIVGSYRVQGSTGRMSIPLRNSLLRLERRNLRFGHSSVDDGFTRDGRGIRQIFSDIEPGVGGAHPNGIVIDGPNTIEDDDHITHATRGAIAIDPVKAYVASEGGGDFELVPVDETHPPTSRAWEPGDLVELATWAFQGIDRTDPTSSDYLAFDYPGNLQDFTAGPDFEAMCNYVVSVANGGEIDADDTDFRRLAAAASWAFDGILERWEAIDVGDQAASQSDADYKERVRALLLARARYLVKQYQDAPAVIELVLPADRPYTPAWGRDYGVGDRVPVDLERGWWSYTGNVRIMSVQVSKFGASGFAIQTLQVTPVGAGDPVDDDESGA